METSQQMVNVPEVLGVSTNLIQKNIQPLVEQAVTVNLAGE